MDKDKTTISEKKKTTIYSKDKTTIKTTLKCAICGRDMIIYMNTPLCSTCDELVIDDLSSIRHLLNKKTPKNYE